MKSQYVAALCREMELAGGSWTEHRFSTLYLGGGTPSQLDTEALKAILLKADSVFGLSGLEEATVECNPDDINETFLSGLKETPINRISMGIQSLDNDILRFIRRRHTAEEAIKAVKMCKSQGYNNISADLIYGFPGQTVDGFISDLKQITDLGVTHISAYCLSYEEGTPLQKMLSDGRITPASDDLCAEMYDALCDTMRSEGFIHYEVSNFSLSGYHSRHNSRYWDGTPYLGIGAGAHSFDGVRRSWNVADIDRYIRGIESGTPERELETLSRDERRNEAVMLSLRTQKGLSISGFSREFGQEAASELLRSAIRWTKSGDLILEGDTLRFSESGLFRGDGIICSLFV